MKPGPLDTDRDHERDAGARGPATFRIRVAQALPGLGIAVALAAVATFLGHLVPVVGAPVFAIVGGIAASLWWTPSRAAQPGLAFASKYVLQGSIVVLGTGLSFHQVLATGSSSLPVLLGTLAVALAGAAVIGRRMSIERDLRTLIGVGTGICGASAIAATDAVIGASEVDVSYAIATIFTFNVAAVLTFPTIGHLLDLSPHAFGVWSGTAVNDMSSVVAASSIFGHGATSTAVVVKLTRTLMIIPISIALALWRARRSDKQTAAEGQSSVLGHVRHIFPVFIGWFLVAVTINTLGVIPRSWHTGLSNIAQVLITIALAAIGLSTQMRDIRKAGLRPLALGAILWVSVGLTSLGLQLATGSLHSG
jgi:uncharacterized integral membrane protein (TIGR00698 family)